MELRAWVERLMGLGPEWRIERVDEDSERQEARLVLAREAGTETPIFDPISVHNAALTLLPTAHLWPNSSRISSPSSARWYRYRIALAEPDDAIP